jgi:hypothetical protein
MVIYYISQAPSRGSYVVENELQAHDPLRHIAVGVPVASCTFRKSPVFVEVRSNRRKFFDLARTSNRVQAAFSASLGLTAKFVCCWLKDGPPLRGEGRPLYPPSPTHQQRLANLWPSMTSHCLALFSRPATSTRQQAKPESPSAITRSLRSSAIKKGRCNRLQRPRRIPLLHRKVSSCCKR